jgi:ribosomal protein S18 acetylase RimI-like enzyme
MAELTLRPVTAEDRPFLERVYASTRAEELAVVPWTDLQKAAFLRFQFDDQDRHYRQHYAQARFDVVLAGGTAVGRLYVDRSGSEIRLIDIALLPEHRGAGIGSALLGALIAEARREQKPLTIHVEHGNPAQRLYQRLGFRFTGSETGVYRLMEWRASDERPASAT